ncbi:MAG: hypothetical protein FWH52_07290, partial [Synergistaceae bacterium]|nr:hypothetical protein [Synergistaceae bacterium]
VPQIQASIDQDLTVIYDPAPVREEKNKNSNGGNGPTTVITKKYVLDYTSPLRNVIMESETGGFTYRYVYGLEKLSVAISPVTTGGGGLIQNGQVKLWYHHDRLGSVDYLSDNVSGKIASYIDYDEWGAPLKKSVLKLGQRELQDVAVEYTVHPYDMVLGVYFAQARMYDATSRRFLSVDWIGGNIAYTQSFNRYAYVLDNPTGFIDIFGLDPSFVNGGEIIVGRESIKKVYVDEGGIVYVDFIEAVSAYGLELRILETSPSGMEYGEILSPNMYSYVRVTYGFFTHSGMFSYKRDYRTDTSSENWKTLNSYAQNGSTPYYMIDNRPAVDFKYYRQIMCDLGYRLDYSFNDKLSPLTEMPNGRIINIPLIMTGIINGQRISKSTQGNWYSYQGSAPVIDANGRYIIVVGPKVLDPNYSDRGQIFASDFNFPVRIDIVLKSTLTGEITVKECVVIGGAKAHTYNKYPDGHPMNAYYAYGVQASFDVENGLHQTGLSYPNCTNNNYEPQYAPANIDGSTIEFVGTGLDFNPANYELLRIRVNN